MKKHIRVMNTILYCQRWRETVTFYRDILEFSITFENNWFVEFRINEGARLSVANEQRATIKSASGRGLTLAFRVDQADEIWNSISAKGIKTGKVANHPWGGRSFFLFDPEGNRLEIWSM